MVLLYPINAAEEAWMEGWSKCWVICQVPQDICSLTGGISVSHQWEWYCYEKLYVVCNVHVGGASQSNIKVMGVGGGG